ncbi:response regulator transcription factor [Xylanivirga thermophila]|uniref:response regulator transcription factor n=1 Tax=Xylanivirga thermophila TaxID=2496273 RepID=UPI00101DC528|nr:response regulator transcription factor [Xylanivirga thermophila]
MEKKILIIEDEDAIRGFVKINFERNKYIVLEAASGEDGIEVVKQEKPDVVILDIMLPGIDGFKVCEILRQGFPHIGIIMLTARNLEMDRIMGLEFGADDYVVKPFNPMELVLRVEALLRRMETKTDKVRNAIIYSGSFKLDPYSQRAYKDGNELDITPKEYLLLKLFMENPGRAFTRDELLDLVWGYNFIGDSKIIDVNIRRLRTKIEDSPSRPVYIETIWGTGYRWKKM